MPVHTNNFFTNVTKHPERFYIIHYSSQSLYDEGVDGLSPRITSIRVDALFYAPNRELRPSRRSGVARHFKERSGESLRRNREGTAGTVLCLPSGPARKILGSLEYA